MEKFFIFILFLITAIIYAQDKDKKALTSQPVKSDTNNNNNNSNKKNDTNNNNSNDNSNTNDNEATILQPEIEAPAPLILPEVEQHTKEILPEVEEPYKESETTDKESTDPVDKVVPPTDQADTEVSPLVNQNSSDESIELEEETIQ